MGELGITAIARGCESTPASTARRVRVTLYSSGATGTYSVLVQDREEKLEERLQNAGAAL